MPDNTNPTQALTYRAKNWLVRLGTQLGNELAAQGENKEEEFESIKSVDGLGVGFNVLAVRRSAGGAVLDSMDAQWALSGHMTNRSQPTQFAQAVEVFIPDNNDDPKSEGELRKNTRIGWGDYVTEATKVTPRGERLTASCQIRPYHFGQPFAGQEWYDNGEFVTADIGPTFNPRVDGKIRGNRSSIESPAVATHFVWIHPEAALTSAAETANNQEASTWTLKQAVQAIVARCLNETSMIALPDSYDIFDGATDIKDLSAPLGQYLPFYLDWLLPPLGFGWCLDYDTDANAGDTRPKLRFFQRGVGDAKTIKAQKPSRVTHLSLNSSNSNDFEVVRRIGDQPNAVRVLGDWIRREVTVRLWPTWPESEDTKTAEDMDKNGIYFKGGGESIHRKWIANEAGDYGEIRDDALQAQPLDLSEVFPPGAVYLPHRRTPTEPISYMGQHGESKTTAPFFVEYTTGNPESETSWQVLPDNIAGNLLLLPEEIGIYFNGTQPPETLIEGMPDVYLRLTCVIACDSRVTGWAAMTGTAANASENILTINAPDKFFDTQVATEGDFASRLYLNSTARGAKEQDDTDAIQNFAVAVRNRHESAELASTFRLPGLHSDYKIGDLLTNVDGRDISLNEAGEGATDRYPQIMGIEYVWNPGPMTILKTHRGIRGGDIRPEQKERMS